jgi:hypothetical protein
LIKKILFIYVIILALFFCSAVSATENTSNNMFYYEYDSDNPGLDAGDDKEPAESEPFLLGTYGTSTTIGSAELDEGFKPGTYGNTLSTIPNDDEHFLPGLYKPILGAAELDEGFKPGVYGNNPIEKKSGKIETYDETNSKITHAHSSSKKIPLKSTGIPLTGIFQSILLIAGGFLATKCI